MAFPFKLRTLLIVAAVAAATVFNAAGATFNLGFAGSMNGDRYALFSLGGGMKDDDVTGNANVFGAVGAAGNGDVDLTGNAIIHGNLYYHDPGTLKVKNNGTITGMAFQDPTHDGFLDQGVTDANNASNFAFAQVATNPTTKIDHSMTITGSGQVVLRLTDFNLDKNDTLTLTGAPGTTFIFNITHNFAMHGNSQIILGAGINVDDVLFNVRGGGGDAVIDGQAHFQGILMANMRNARIDGDSVSRGEIIANHIDIKHNAVISR